MPESDILANAGMQNSTVAAISGNTILEINGWVDGSLIVSFDKKGLKGPSIAPNPMPGDTALTVVRCQTASSPFETMDGSLLYFQNHGIFDPEAFGRLCIVDVQNSLLVRVIKRGYGPGKHNLTLPNRVLTEEDVLVKNASPVLWMKF